MPSKIAELFKDQKLLSPVGARPGFLDLVHAVQAAIGLAGTTKPLYLPRHRHLILALIDGMGADQISEERTPFLKRHLQNTLRALFPSTTSVVLTSLCTAAWPADHAISGWWTYLSPDRVAVPLPFLDRETQKPLAQFGISFKEISPLKVWWKRGRRRSLCLQPQYLVGSVYSTAFSGGMLQRGYRDLDDALAICREHWALAESKRQTSLIYLYFPKLDSASHRFGPKSAEVRDLLTEIDLRMEQLAAKLPRDAMLLVTADHGQSEAGDAIWWEKSDPLLSMLETAPTGEPSLPIFHVKPGLEDEFKRAFTERHQKSFELCSPDELAELRLFGPRRICPLLQKRLGNFLGIAERPCSLYVEGVWDGKPHLGLHGGLRPSEMQIPLIVYENCP